MNARGVVTALMFSLVAGFPSLAGADSQLEYRVARLERILSNQSISDLVLQLQRLQEEVQRLRGKVDEQQHDIEMLQKQAQGRSLDEGTRLRGQIGRGEGVPGSEDAGPPDDAASPSARAGLTGGERELYQTAFDLLKQRRYEEAAAAFQDLLARYPRGQFADNAHYWLGETYYVKQDYPAALAEFQRVLDDYPLSPKVPGSMLKMGYIYYEQGNWTRARATLQDVTAKFPDTNEGGFAQSRLDRMSREGH
jgi:tol-pal system protein YbgF